jgi:hypothetical protein
MWADTLCPAAYLEEANGRRVITLKNGSTRLVSKAQRTVDLSVGEGGIVY